MRVARKLMYPAATQEVDALDRRTDPAFQAYKWGTALVLAVVGLLIYEVIGRVDLGRSTTLLMTSLDRAIPLVPWTAWFYEPFYVAIFLIGVVGFRSRYVYDRTLVCIGFNIVVSALGHAFVRAEYPRPVLPVPAPDLSVAFLAFVYKIDPAGNVFPSLHVAHTFMISFLLSLDRPRLGRVLLWMSVVLAISTLTTKQHFIADVVAGLAMALIGRAWAQRQVARVAPSALPVPLR